MYTYKNYNASIDIDVNTIDENGYYLYHVRKQFIVEIEAKNPIQAEALLRRRYTSKKYTLNSILIDVEPIMCVGFDDIVVSVEECCPV